MVHAFRYKEDYFALDVETGSVHLLDEQAFEAVQRLEEIERSGGDIDAALRGGGMMDELRALREEGLLFSRARRGRKQAAKRRQGHVPASCARLQPALWLLLCKGRRVRRAAGADE